LTLSQQKLTILIRLISKGILLKWKIEKKIGRKSGGIILGYKDHLEKDIEPLETESKFYTTTVQA
jgi:hypothetical protein